MSRLLIATTVPNFLRAFLLPYVRHFRSLGWTVDAIANGVSQNAECLDAFDRVWDVPWARNPLLPSNLLQAPRTVAEIVGKGAYDIVHVHTPVAGLACRLALRKPTAGGPVRIYTAHGFHFHKHGSFLRNTTFLGLEKLAGRWTDYLIVINREDETSARRHNLVSPDRLVYMPGIGVDLETAYKPVSVSEIAAFYAERGLPAGTPVFAVVAEFIPRKRNADALRALAALGRGDVHLLMAGTGPTLPAMKRLARDLGIAERVHFLGFRKDVRCVVGAARATLLCSDQEGLPRSVMESMSLGVPVIGSDIRGTRELLEGSAGYLYELGNIRQLSQAMALVLDRPEEAAHRAQLACSNLSTYTLPRLIRAHEDLYSRALANRAGTPACAALV
jgi:glycosyltransferase involved in cell wall biosynthesis